MFCAEYTYQDDVGKQTTKLNRNGFRRRLRQILRELDKEDRTYPMIVTVEITAPDFPVHEKLHLDERDDR